MRAFRASPAVRDGSDTILKLGTPEGVITGYPKEKQVWLKPGDKLTTTIEKLGTLRFS